MPIPDRSPRDLPRGRPEPEGGGRAPRKAAGEGERRRWSRASADWPISLGLADGRFEARVRDVSQAGVCFFLDRPVATMTVLAVDLELPVPGGKRLVKGRGVVVRCERISERIDHYEIAVYLDQLAQPDREVLAAYVAEQNGGRRTRSAGE